MKKVIAIVLTLVVALGLFAACEYENAYSDSYSSNSVKSEKIAEEKPTSSNEKKEDTISHIEEVVEERASKNHPKAGDTHRVKNVIER